MEATNDLTVANPHMKIEIKRARNGNWEIKWDNNNGDISNTIDRFRNEESLLKYLKETWGVQFETEWDILEIIITFRKESQEEKTVGF